MNDLTLCAFLAVATGLNNFSRVLGGALGVAIASATLNSSLNSDLPQILPADLLTTVLEYPEGIRSGSIPEQYIQPVLYIYLEGLHTVYSVLTAMSGVCKLCRCCCHAENTFACMLTLQFF